jgi:hypothetical protein
MRTEMLSSFPQLKTIAIVTEEPTKYNASAPLPSLATLEKKYKDGSISASTYFLQWLTAHADTGLPATSITQLMEELKIADAMRAIAWRKQLHQADEEDVKRAIGSLLMQGHLKIANGSLEWRVPLSNIG